MPINKNIPVIVVVMAIAGVWLYAKWNPPIPKPVNNPATVTNPAPVCLSPQGCYGP